MKKASKNILIIFIIVVIIVGAYELTAISKKKKETIYGIPKGSYYLVEKHLIDNNTIVEQLLVSNNYISFAGIDYYLSQDSEGGKIYMASKNASKKDILHLICFLVIYDKCWNEKYFAKILFIIILKYNCISLRNQSISNYTKY